MPDLYPFVRNVKRRHLLEVAERLFAEKGYEAVPIRHLAKEAGVNIAMVSYYFGSKEKLFEALIASKFPQTRKQLGEIAKKNISPWEKLLETVDLYAEKFFEGRNFHRMIMREMSLSQRPEHVRLITDHLAQSLGVISGFILEGQEKGLFSETIDIPLTLATVFGSFSALISQGKLMCAILGEDCEENVYAEKSRQRFKDHLASLLRAHLMTA
jgi:AcrR family transcriptional regulator